MKLINFATRRGGSAKMMHGSRCGEKQTPSTTGRHAALPQSQHA